MAKYNLAIGGKWTQLSLPPFKNKFGCCDCGSVHRHDYMIKKITKGRPGLTLWVKITADKRATAAMRRQMHKSKRKS